MFANRFAEKRRTQPAQFRPSRRAFLAGTAAAGAGLTIGLGSAQAQTPAAAAAINPFGAYVRIGADNKVTVLAAHMDMGQGCYFGIATLVAEELDAASGQLAVEGAAGNLAAYGNVAWGGTAQGTGGSTAMASSWERYRRAGAICRAMLVSATARAWGVPGDQIVVKDGTLFHAPSGRGATFGQMADAAAREPIPQNVALKAPAQWTRIGNPGYRRIDSAAKANGTQQFTIDVRLPGMLVAVPVHAPLFGGKLRRMDAAAARAVPGVTDIVTTSRGAAVVATNTWAALKGAEALKIEWDDTAAEKRGSAAMMADYRARADQPGQHVAVARGDAPGAIAGAARTLEASYEFPYLAHAALEGLNAVVARQGDIVEIWGGHQIPDLYAYLASQAMGMSPANVRMRVMKTGGGFGRRAVADGDVVVEAAEIAKAIGFKAPVKLQWPRESDMAGGRYRPMMAHKVRVGLDASGNIAGWHHRIVGQSILIGTPFESMMVKDGVDGTSVEGVADTLYALPNLRVEVTNMASPVPVLWWRSVGHSHTAYVMETMIDEIAAASGKDPLALRRQLLARHPRHLAALNLAAARANWGTPLPTGRFRGLAAHESFGTSIGMVVEISTGPRNAFRVERVVAGVACGTAVNPDQVRAQVEGGVGFALGAILREELTLDGGKVVETNYDAYRPLRIDEMPKVEVHIVASSSAPTGIGEPGVPPLGPALANALAAATGKRVRILPIEKGLSV
jgi:isoquinoline 1-oxidoreductase subunit beta